MEKQWAAEEKVKLISNIISNMISEYPNSEQIFQDICNQRYEILTPERGLVYFYSNPSQQRNHNLKSLVTEMESIMSDFSGVSYRLLPDATFEDIGEYIGKHRPNIIGFSAHSVKGLGIFFKKIVVTEDQFVAKINSAIKAKNYTPACIILAACESDTIADKLSKELPNTFIMYWTTIVEDTAASMFTRLFFKYIKEYIDVSKIGLNEISKIGLNEITKENCIAAFSRAVNEYKKSFEIGDPNSFLKYRVQPPKEVRGIMAYTSNGQANIIPKTAPTTPPKTQNNPEPNKKDPPNAPRKGKETRPGTTSGTAQKTLFNH